MPKKAHLPVYAHLGHQIQMVPNKHRQTISMIQALYQAVQISVSLGKCI